ncbi:membrane protein FAM174B [Cetorhinus maximus]
MCCWRLCALALLPLLAAELSSVPEAKLGPPAPLNRSALAGPLPGNNATGTASTTAAAFGNIASILRHFSTLKNLVLVACAGAFLLIVGLLVRVIRSGRKIKKTRKYDIITTPAEKVEMTPLKEDDDDDEDATVFDVKYSR